MATSCDPGVSSRHETPTRFVNPSRNVLTSFKTYHYYPIANSAAFDLCEDIPQRAEANPLTVCLLAAGDVRNVLFTTYRRQSLGDRRKLLFYVNDISPSIVAKDILLLALAAKTPLEQGPVKIGEHADLFLSLWADLALSKGHKEVLDAMLTQLLEAFTGKGEESFMKVKVRHHLWEIKKAWAVWLTTNESLKSAFGSRKPIIQWDCSGLDVSAKKFNSGMETLSYVMDLTPNPMTEDELSHYIDNGTMLRPESSSAEKKSLNVTMRDSVSKNLPQNTSYPFITYHLSSEKDDYLPAESHSLYRALHRTVMRLLIAFAKAASKRQVAVHFDVGDCNAFLATRLESDVKFDVIDTSNIVDHTGVAALLTVASQRINRLEPNSTLWMETVKSIHVYDSAEEILQNSLWIPYSILPTVLQVKCTLPFESCLDFDTELGRHHRKIYLTGVKFKWTPLLHGRDDSCKVEMSSEPSSCVFRKMIDNMLGILCTIYKRKPANFHSAEGFYPNSSLYTVSAMMAILLSATRQLKNPQALINHLYERVHSDCQLLSFEVQNVARQMYPDQLQPSAPLHPLFAQLCGSESSVYCIRLHRTNSATRSPCPIMGGLLVRDLPESQCLAWLSSSPLGQQLNVRNWMNEHLDRVQFIDSFTIASSPQDELEIRLPNGLVLPNSPYSILLLDLSTGQLLFDPLPLSTFKLRLTKARLFSCISSRNFAHSLPKCKHVTVDQVLEYEGKFELVVSSPIGQTVTMLRKNSVLPGKSLHEMMVKFVDEMKPLQISFPNYCHNGQKVDYNVSVNKANSTISITIAKPSDALKPTRQLLDMDKLKIWPRKPFGPRRGMLTISECLQQTSGSGYSIGHDPYYDARVSLIDFFADFIWHDKKLAAKGIFKQREDGSRLFQFISSPRKRIFGNSSRLLASPRRIPILEFWYVCTDGDLTPEMVYFISHIQRTIETASTSCMGEEIDVLREQLKKNSKRIVNTAPIVIAGVSLQRSFFIPLYSKESKMGESIPPTVKSDFHRELDQRRHERGIDRPAPSHAEKCFTCSEASNLLRCGKCRKVWFCSKKCQKAGWKKHKINCHPMTNT
eukprot:m.178590 g.178590  ORF g.178590 m.178590 type:complete len:1082 (+) comp39180_c0_seq4:119-3364(+)